MQVEENHGFRVLQVQCLLIMMIVMCGLSSPVSMYGDSGAGVPRLRAVTSSGDGPTIVPEVPTAIDMISNGTCVDVVLVLRANVTDANGVATVIGSYSNQSEGIWRNVTMHADPEMPGGHFFVSYPVNYTLQRGSGSGVDWNITFYAQNTLGVWSRASTFLSVVCWFVPTETTTTNGDSPNLVVPAAVIMVVAIAVLVLIVRRK